LIPIIDAQRGMDALQKELQNNILSGLKGKSVWRVTK